MSVVVELQDDEAILFREFQRRYSMIATLVGFMSSLNVKDISNSQVILDIDNQSVVRHVSITKHYSM